MDRNLALEFVRVTEASALAAASWIGRGDEKSADKAAAESMQCALNTINFDGTVLIGEETREESPKLCYGSKVGTGDGPKVTLACDPLEGTAITAFGRTEALSVIACTETGRFLRVPDTYMNKVAVGAGAKGVIDIQKGAVWNMFAVAEALGKDVHNLMVVILDRPRHRDLIDEVRNAGARIRLIGDGDVSAAVATAQPQSGVDLLLGSGGAKEGVIAAAALRCLGGDMQGVIECRTDEEKTAAKDMGITDLNKIYSLDELASGDVMFVATGVTDGCFLRGVRGVTGGAHTHSMVVRSKTGTQRDLTTFHRFSKDPEYGW